MRHLIGLLFGLWSVGVAYGQTPEELNAAANKLREGITWSGLRPPEPEKPPPPPEREKPIVTERLKPPVVVDKQQNWVDRTNAGTVGIITGGVAGTYIRFGADLQSALDNGDNLRILPILGRGSLQNIADLLYLRGVDVAIVQSDSLAFAKFKHLYPGVDQNVQYVTKLYNEEVHILARGDIGTVGDLQGQPVNIDNAGSGTAMTSMLLFDALKIQPDWRTDDQHTALDKLRHGQIAAMIYVVGRPARLFSEVPPDTMLHFLALPMNPAFADVYEPSTLTPADYPNLVQQNMDVPTVSVSSVMAVFGWPANSDRYRKVARFVDAFLDNFNDLLKPARHPKWQEVDLLAEVPGWKRFPEATAWIQRRLKGVPMKDLNAFLATMPGMTPANKSRLMLRYEEFRRGSAINVSNRHPNDK